MKRILFSLFALILTISIYAQSPEKMSFQAVVRNATGELVAKQQVGIQISILQGSVDGSVVYSETQTPTTNTNGLFAIEIGEGVSANDFSTINWANGPFFIKTETDPDGGTNYSIVGTNQLLSVPYALHAKTAELITGTINETDPAYASSEAANITSNDITNLGNLSGTNTGDQDISGITTNSEAISNLKTQVQANASSAASKITADDIANLGNLSGTNTGDQDISGITTNSEAISNLKTQVQANASSAASKITADDITNLGNLSGTNTGDQDISGIATNAEAISNIETQLQSNASAVKTYKIGDRAQGGIVFWVDPTGQHGLVVAEKNYGKAIRWYAGTNGYTYSKGGGLYAGALNTAIIIAAHAAIGDDGEEYAARVCNEYKIYQNGIYYGDWYLPSIDELRMINTNKSAANISIGGTVWSSTEINSSGAYVFTFYPIKIGNGPKNKRYSVRCIRRF